MSPTTGEANDVLNENNYFAWEFNARMKLAKKGLLKHIDATKAPSDGDISAPTCKVNDMKAFAIVYHDKTKSSVHYSECSLPNFFLIIINSREILHHKFFNTLAKGFLWPSLEEALVVHAIRLNF